MPFDDDKFGTLFPTRTGDTIGAANERKMLDAIGGADGFRTRMRTGPNGVTTILRTKNGMPHFSNLPGSPAEVPPDEADQSIYMETGELTWSVPGLENPTRSYPATWHFGNVAPSGAWLGQVSLAGVQATPQPTPADTGVLRDSIDSLAIGFPRKLYPDDTVNPTTDAASRDTYSDTTVLKKLVASWFPPEKFSGKLRQFIQAQYGAKETPGTFFYSIEVLGESALLQYQPTSLAEAPRIQFYFWSHATTGLFTGPDYTYYLIQITSSNTPGNMDITGMPIRLSASGKALRKAIIAGTITGDNIKKAEAYMFAEAVIETNKQFYAGSFPVGSCGTGGGTLAWGWKFNQAGTAASIVMVGTVGDSAGGTLDGRARETHAAITRSAVYDGIEAGKWGVSATGSGEYSWLDGWGSFNIMAPDSEVSTQLFAYSHKITWGTVADYNYSDVPVYGFYDKDDAWKTVRLSKTIRTDVFWEQQQSGLTLSPSAEAAAEYPTYPPEGLVWKEVGVRRSDSGARVDMRRIDSHQRMTVSIAGYSYDGYRKTGFSDVYQVNLLGSGFTQFIDGFGTDWLYGPNHTFVSAPSEFAESVAAREAAPFGYNYEGDGEVERPLVEHRHTTCDFDESQRWTVVIPAGDCECVHLATASYRHSSNVASWTGTTNSWGAQTDYWIEFETFPNSAAFQHLNSHDMPWCWVGFMYESPPALTRDDVAETFAENTTVLGWSRTLNAASGSPSGSYSTLFDVAREWPQFNGTIYFKESANGRYYGSEGYNSGSVLPNSLFVGWY